MPPRNPLILFALFAAGVMGGLGYLLFPASKDDSTATETREPPMATVADGNSSQQLATDGTQAQVPMVYETDSSTSQDQGFSDPSANDQPQQYQLRKYQSQNSPTNESLDLEDFNEHSQQIVSLRNEGDIYLVAGNFTTVALRFQKCQKISGRITSDIAIRLGLCAEFDDRPAVAAQHYRRALDKPATTNHRLLALSGISRTWIERGNRREALHILSDLFIESLGKTKMPEEIQAQINYQLGVAIQDLALKDYHYDLNRADGVSFLNTPPELAPILELLNSNAAVGEKFQNQTSKGSSSTFQASTGDKNSSVPTHQLPASVFSSTTLTDDHPRITVLQRPNDSIDLMIVDVDSGLQPLSVITKNLTAACELELFASDQARTAIIGRSKSIHVTEASASQLLDHLLIPLQLFWYQDDRGIHLLSLDEPDSDPLVKEFWQSAMERAFRRFNVAFPGDYRQMSALLSRGNLKFIRGDLDRAANQYQELSNLNPKDEMLARLFFNIGKVEMQLGRNENSIRHFYHAVDQSYDTQFQSTGYWLVGQLSLEVGILDDAIKASGRALSLAHTDQQKRQAALTMSRAYLLSNQPFSANQVLFTHHRAFQGTELEPTAAVLGCYARFVGVTDEISRDIESHRLLAAVAMAPDNQYENFLDIYIAARAYQELGFQERAIEKLTLAADSTTIATWRRRFLFELGVQLTYAGNLEKATPIFEFLMEGDEDQWLENSLLQLAQIYVTRQRNRDCIMICEQLWGRSLSDAAKKTTLDAMGRAYRNLGEHHSAALCFAGMIPTQSVQLTGEKQ